MGHLLMYYDVDEIYKIIEDVKRILRMRLMTYQFFFSILFS